MPNALDSQLRSAIATAPSQVKWPDQNYVKLLDLADVTVKPDGTQVAVYRETFKLFNRNARGLAEVQLPFDSAYQQVTLLGARTVQPGGTVLTVTPTDVRHGSPAAEFAMYDDAAALLFSMPGIVDNCVIDYEYKVITRPFLIPGTYALYWGFSDSEPVVISSYRLHVPAGHVPAYTVYNAPDLKPVMSFASGGKEENLTWTMRNIAPVKIEPAMPMAPLVRSWMQISSIPSWNSIADWFHGLQQPQSTPTATLRQLAASLTRGCTTEDARSEKLFNWTSQKVRYVGLELGLSAYRPHRATEVCDNLYGDCKDKANLLIALLSIEHIKAYPALLHANDPLPVEGQLPALSAFNHCIVRANVDGKWIWLDPTASDCPYGDIPAADRGAQALVIMGSKGQFETVPPYTTSNNGSDIVFDVHMVSSTVANVTCTLTLRGVVAQSLRGMLSRVPVPKQKEAINSLAQSLGLQSGVNSFHLMDEDRGGPLLLTIIMDQATFGKAVGNMVMLPVYSAMSGTAQHNPYISTTRIWPIVSLNASHLTTKTLISLPSSWHVADVPAPVNIADPLQRYTRNITSADNGANIVVTDEYMQDAGSAPAVAYPKVQSFWSGLLKVSGDVILISKAGG
jgi:transglutaminase-like putative cysteine protease